MTETQERVKDVENVPNTLKFNRVRQCELSNLKKVSNVLNLTRVRQCKLTY